MGLGDSLLNSNYNPLEVEKKSALIETPYIAPKTIKCPVKFTDDPLEFLESNEYMGEELRPKQRLIIEDLFYSFKEDGSPKYTEAAVICGMRGGKSVIASYMTSFLTQRLLSMDVPSIELGQKRGQQLTAEFIATSEEQSQRTAYAAFVGDIQQNPWWVKYIDYLLEREKNGEGVGKLFTILKPSVFFREKNVIIQSLHSNSNSIAGMTSYMVVFDEMSRFRVSDGQNQGITEASTAQAVYNTASRSAKSVAPFSRILTVTSPMFETDYGMQLLYLAKDIRVESNTKEISLLRKKHKPKISYNENMIAYNFTTYEMAPKQINKYGKEVGFTEKDFINELNQNPIAYRRDYLAIPPGAENPYFEYPERIEMCLAEEDRRFKFVDRIVEDTAIVDGGVEIRKYIAKDIYIDAEDKLKRYFLCCDQGKSKDKFVIAMGHVDDYSNIPDMKKLYTIKIDFVEAWIPDKANQVTVSFANVEEVIKVLATKFNIVRVTYDQWNSAESLQRLFSAGVASAELGIKTSMYDEFKRMVYTGLVEMPNNTMLTNELRQLNLVRGTEVDHPKNGGKDLSDAVCRVVVSCYNDYLERAANGEIMTGQTFHMPTVRSMQDYYRQESNNIAMGGGNSVFGQKDFFVPRTVPKNGPQRGNINLNKFWK